MEELLHQLEKEEDSGCTLKDQRVIMVCEQIDDISAERVSKELLELDQKEVGDIVLYINSPGGCVHSGLQIIDTMNFIHSDVITINTGMAASMGFCILVNGAKGKRFSLPHSHAMAHQVSSGTSGMIEDMQIRLDHAKRLNRVLMTHIAKSINKSFKEVMEMVDRDMWFNAKEMLKLGGIDAIIKDKDDIHNKLTQPKATKKKKVTKKTTKKKGK